MNSSAGEIEVIHSPRELYFVLEFQENLSIGFRKKAK